MPPPSLRLRSLRKLLASSPTLARPLADATVGALRSATASDRAAVLRRRARFGTGGGGHDGSGENRAAGFAGGEGTWSTVGGKVYGEEKADGSDSSWWVPPAPGMEAPPSREALMALLLALRMEERRQLAGTRLAIPASTSSRLDEKTRNASALLAAKRALIASRRRARRV